MLQNTTRAICNKVKVISHGWPCGYDIGGVIIFSRNSKSYLIENHYGMIQEPPMNVLNKNDFLDIFMKQINNLWKTYRLENDQITVSETVHMYPGVR